MKISQINEDDACYCQEKKQVPAIECGECGKEYHWNCVGLDAPPGKIMTKEALQWLCLEC